MNVSKRKVEKNVRRSGLYAGISLDLMSVDVNEDLRWARNTVKVLSIFKNILYY